MRALRVSHSAVVDEWRGRERALAGLGVDVALLSARTWNEGGAPVALQPRPDEHGRRVRERVAAEQPERRGVALEEPDEELEEPVAPVER